MGSSTTPKSSPSAGTRPLSHESGSVRTTSPSPSALGVRRSLFGSPSLLPAFTTLHATPAILSLLQPSSYIPGNASHLDLSLISGPSSETRRLLHHVHLNIGTTLYTGLRPNAVMANLKSASVKVLGIRFGGGGGQEDSGEVPSCCWLDAWYQRER
ncbi:hypothetical protein FA13DRAFT_1331922 [Coprinellus micaceus]|uniref:Uncharacterized protein n=1 Tax=Coprinellus micaceus TaxID=71717 RepID=A0A4Y7TMX6_COPMI|nr:hypothetical protein FA13DRAFT_1331922 [Coprinellus micaceus]